MKKSAWTKHLKKCPMDHGGPMNVATVYGHWASLRVCMRIKAGDVWVYDPAWEKEPESS